METATVRSGYLNQRSPLSTLHRKASHFVSESAETGVDSMDYLQNHEHARSWDTKGERWNRALGLVKISGVDPSPLENQHGFEINKARDVPCTVIPLCV